MQRSAIFYAAVAAIFIWGGFALLGRIKHNRVLAAWEPYRSTLARMNTITATVEWAQTPRAPTHVYYRLKFMKPNSLYIDYFSITKGIHRRYIMTPDLGKSYDISPEKHAVPRFRLAPNHRVGHEVYPFAAFFSKGTELPFTLSSLVPVSVRQKEFLGHIVDDFAFNREESFTEQVSETWKEITRTRRRRIVIPFIYYDVYTKLPVALHLQDYDSGASLGYYIVRDVAVNPPLSDKDFTATSPR